MGKEQRQELQMQSDACITPVEVIAVKGSGADPTGQAMGQKQQLGLGGQNTLRLSPVSGAEKWC